MRRMRIANAVRWAVGIACLVPCLVAVSLGVQREVAPRFWVEACTARAPFAVVGEGRSSSSVVIARVALTTYLETL